MNLISRILLLRKRRAAASRYGVKFRGTSIRDSLDTLFINGQPRTIKTPDSTGHWHDFINICLDDEYGLNALGTSPKTIFDIGANIGIFSLFARDCFPEASIHCYEPNPALTPLLRHNLEGLNIEIHEKAIGPVPGLCRIDENSDNRCSRIEHGGKIEIESFDQALSRIEGDIDLLKIDIEGSEWPLFLELDRFAFQRIRRIVMEYHEIKLHSFDDLLEAA